MSFDLLNSASASSSAFRVVCGEMTFDDDWNVHSEVVLAILKKGTMTVETADNYYKLSQGDICFIAPNRKYRVSEKNNAVIDAVLLNLSNPASVTQEYVPQTAIRGLVTGNCTHFAKVSARENCYNELFNAIKVVIRAESEKGEYFQLLVHGKLYEIFYILFAGKYIRVFEIENQGKKYRALRKITEYINENYCENISLDTISQTTGLSRYYVSHLFKELMNTTFVNYVNELRLNRAAMLLATTDTPIIEIAGLSGFNNISNFNRAFKMYHNVTPSKYRKMERN